MQHAMKSCPMDVVEEYFWGKIALRVRGLQAGESLWVHSNGVKKKANIPQAVHLSWLSKICNHLGEIDSGSRKSLTLIKQKWRFFGKKTPYRQIFTNVFQNPTCRHGNTTFCANFVKFGRPDVGEIARYLMDQKNKISARAAASVRIAPKICQGQLQTIFSEFPKVHPNPFTSSGVIAERVNIVQTRHKVFPILGEASASSPSNKWLHEWTLWWRSCLNVSFA